MSDQPSDTIPTDMDSQDASVDRWSWLADTYWYVPTAYLPAILLENISSPKTSQVNDQTLWYFEQFTGGYLIGQAAISINGGDFSYNSVVGSVTPEGDVCLSFVPSGAVSANVTGGISIAPVTIGTGRLVQRQGQWAFLMQMTGGTGAINISHWAYMVQSTPEDSSWTDIPGVPDTSIGAVFAD